ncbi:hypothetical protein, partial [Mesorhizobium sp. BHbdii]
MPVSDCRSFVKIDHSNQNNSLERSFQEWHSSGIPAWSIALSSLTHIANDIPKSRMPADLAAGRKRL